jgi:hypothetical protein
LAGLVLPQVVLYGPSLVGTKVLLPLDLLRMPGLYQPAGDGAGPVYSDDIYLCDAVYQFEPMRRFSAAEVRAGRLPLWRPGVYGGAPFLAQNQSAVFSPLRLLDYAWTSPRAIAWREVLKAILGGLGAFLFFRLALGVGFPAAVLGAWAFPVGGFLVLWANHPHTSVAIWLPWLLLATELSLRRPRGLAPVGLAVITAFALLSGHSGVATHLLMGSALYAVARLIAAPDLRRWGALAMLMGGWGLGAMLSAMQTLPTLEYLASSARIADRVSGIVETPPAGLTALAQLVFPYFLGSSGEGFFYLGQGNRLESAAMGYTGLLFTLGFLPMGLGTRQGRPFVWFIGLFVVVGLAHTLGLPGFRGLFSLGPLATLRNHRLVLLTGFACLSGAVLGLDAWLTGAAPPRWLRRAMVALCLLVMAGMLVRAFVPPAALLSLLSQVKRLALAGRTIPAPLGDPAFLAKAGDRLAWFAFAGAFLSAGCVGLWLFSRRRGVVLGAGALALIELVVMAKGVNPQRDPAGYYPAIPALTALAGKPWGRAVCMGCMPPDLMTMTGLADLRGYDGADPIRWIQLLDQFRDAGSVPVPHARLLNYTPRLPSPIADLLGLRYLIHRGSPPAGVPVVSQSPDYYVVENPGALPRAFVPERVAAVRSATAALSAMVRPDFDPRRVAFVETEQALPAGPARGSAMVVSDENTRLVIEVHLQTPGLVVLADRWDAGWKATFQDVEVPVLRADFDLRGVVLPAGSGRLELRYDPESFRLGLRIAAAAFFIALLLATLAVHRRRRDPARAGLNDKSQRTGAIP